MNKEVIKLIADRIEIGKREYADEIDPHDGRDWEKETLEELLDACVYLATAILQLKTKKKGIQNDPEC
tara:strand:+ start:315 stop:518 length:204 start_codon:yes stop_codon:yes gene_type:complete